MVTVMTASDTRRWWALVAVAASVLVVGLDLTVLNLALPTLSVQLHASTTDLQWFSAAYSLVLAAALLPAGMLGDRIGRKKLLLIALAVFGASSAACAFAGSSGALIVARAILGLGAAAVLPMSIAILPVLFTEDERPRAIAIIMGATFIGYPVGPLLGGWLLDNFWWGSVFLINVPVVVMALIAVALLLPESHGERGRSIDVTGIGLSSLGLAGLTYGFIKAGESGWSDAAALTAILGGAVLLVVFVTWERYITRPSAAAGRTGRPAGRQPLIELALFRSAGFTWGTILTTMVSFAMFGMLFTMPLYFQEVRGMDAFGSGLRMLPMVGGMVLGMLTGTRLQTPPKTPPDAPAAAPRVGARALVTAGFAVMALALAVGATSSASSGTGFAAAWLAAAGIGLGLALPAAMNVALGALSPQRSGAGSALISAMRQVGATIGVAVLGTVLLSAYRSRLDLTSLPAAVGQAVRGSVATGVEVARKLDSVALLDSVRAAFVHGMDVMLWACGGIALTSALLALAFLPRKTSPASLAGQDTPAGQDIPAEPGASGPVGAAMDAGGKNREHERHARR
jgi:MFS transporter, DHA2 family, multidrug resistance protein